jgi:hypothetical protein
MKKKAVAKKVEKKDEPKAKRSLPVETSVVDWEEGKDKDGKYREDHLEHKARMLTDAEKVKSDPELMGAIKKHFAKRHKEIRSIADLKAAKKRVDAGMDDEDDEMDC